MGILDERGGLPGRRAIVVGGAAGIGAAVSLALAEAGVRVALCDNDDEALESITPRLADLGPGHHLVRCDATNSNALAEFYGSVPFPEVDILVHVVGGVKRGPFDATGREEWDGDIQRNFGYVLESTQHALPLLRAGGRGGSIINFTTIEASRGAAGFAVYAGAKAALTNFTRALAVELSAENIRVNAIAPDSSPSAGNVRALTDRQRAEFASMTDEERAELWRIYIPMGVQPPVDALANAVLFLASDLSAFVTGSTLPVDGGTSASMGFLNWPFGGYGPAPKPEVVRRLLARAET